MITKYCVARAAPQVAAYPFTTLMPNLGVMGAGEAALNDDAPPVLVDLPGLIEGASQVGQVFSASGPPPFPSLPP